MDLRVLDDLVEDLVKVRDDISWLVDRIVMGHGVGHYIGLNEIGSPSPMKTFITINYLFNFIFGFIQ